MPIIELLASSQGSRSSDANIKLAIEIASSGNADATAELVKLLQHSNKNIQSDSIKTLYEIGFRNPQLLASHVVAFLAQLNNLNNRLVWGAMAALTSIASIEHKVLFESLDKIMEAVNKGSVITIDCGVEILAKLNPFETYHDTIDPLLMDQLSKCPIKQLPSYAGKALEHIGDHSKEGYLNIISNRMDECEKPTQKKRLEKLLKS